MTTYLIRHAPTTYSCVYRVNGDPGVDVALSDEGEAACVYARTALPDDVASCVVSQFRRCQRTADLLTGAPMPVIVNPRLGELDYGVFEGAEFLTYARWLSAHGPRARPRGAGESQAEGIARMVTGLRAALDHPGPRLVIAHGLLVSVIRWAAEHRGESLGDVFLPAAPCLTPLVVADDDLHTLVADVVDDLNAAARHGRSWRVDLRVFPPEVRTALATVGTHVPLESVVSEKPTEEATHA